MARRYLIQVSRWRWAYFNSSCLDLPVTVTPLFASAVVPVDPTQLTPALGRFAPAGPILLFEIVLLSLPFAVVASVVAAGHFAATANVSYTWDWKRDAGTKAMIDDLAWVINAERAPGSTKDHANRAAITNGRLRLRIIHPRQIEGINPPPGN